jgi:serine/threonine protein kinase
MHLENVRAQRRAAVHFNIRSGTSLMSSDLLEPGSRLAKYQIIAHIATGGMGTVYKAEDLALRRIVALKILSDDVAQNTVSRERFYREARNAARLNHPNIVTLYDFGRDSKRKLHYLALEFVDGIDLGTYIEKRGKLHSEEARLVLIQAGTALGHAFEQGVVHRDIKPSNFLLARVGGKIVVKLTDLGVARRPTDDECRLTTDGNTVGTIDYIAPEQARDSAAADIRSDIYSLGCTAYHMLAGRAPFAQGGLGERLVHHLETPPPDVRQFNAGVSKAFWRILQKMLAKKPEHRYATPNELVEDLKSAGAESVREEEEQTTVMEVNDQNPTVLGDTRKKTPQTINVPAILESESAPPTKRNAAKKPRVEKTAEPEPAPEAVVSAEQARTAAAFHERALEIMGDGGGDDYARQLLQQCMALDPFTSRYRQTLRDLNAKSSAGAFQRWFGSLNALAIKSKLRLARSSSNWRKVLELGEEILALQPADADTHLQMADAANQLRLPALALWLLDKGREQAPDYLPLIRASALLHEDRQNWRTAVKLWEKVRDLDPTDVEASHKINVVLTKDHIAQHRSRK